MLKYTIVYVLLGALTYFVMGGFYFTEQHKIERNTNLQSEFKDFVNHPTQFCEGLFLGESEGVYRYQFPNILDGEGRILTIDYAEEEDGGLQIGETKDLKVGAEAYLLLSHDQDKVQNNLAYQVFETDPDYDVHPDITLEEMRLSLSEEEPTYFVSIDVDTSSIKVQQTRWKRFHQGTFEQMFDLVQLDCKYGNLLCGIDEVNRVSEEKLSVKWIMLDIVTWGPQVIMMLYEEWKGQDS